jgi:prepilin-type N-terminal cleavage/methylation domain-containing protein
MSRRNKSRGFSLIELLIVVAIILIIASIAIPNLLRSKMAANEASAVSVLRNLHNSQAVYVLQFAGVGYASTLAQLGPGVPCDQTHACLTDELIGCAAQPCIKGGYGFYLTIVPSAALVTNFTVSGTPNTWDKTGTRNFCTTEDGVVRFQIGAKGPLAAGELHGNCIDPAQYSALRN